MRTILTVALILNIAVIASAQTAMPVSSLDFMQQSRFNHTGHFNDSNSLHKKWSLSMYSGIGAGFGFFNNGTNAFFPATLGLQLNRRLNNNLYAFAGVSTAPAFFYGGHLFNSTNTGTNFMTTPGFNTNGWGINTAIRAGLMYVNDAKTFSISGSIGVSNNSSPFYPNPQKQPFIGKRQ